MDQNRVRKDLIHAIIFCSIFIVIAISFKFFLDGVIFRDIVDTRGVAFNILTVIFVGILAFVPTAMGYKFVSSSVFFAYFLGLIAHTIQDKTTGSNLLYGNDEGLFWRVLLILIFAVIGAIIESIYQYIKSKKARLEKERILEEKLQRSSLEDK